MTISSNSMTNIFLRRWKSLDFGNSEQGVGREIDPPVGHIFYHAQCTGSAYKTNTKLRILALS